MKTININYAKKIVDENGKPVMVVDTEGKEVQEVYNGIVSMNAPEDFDELGQMWGKEVGFQKAMATIIIDARRLCYEANTPEEAQNMVNAFTPGVSRTRATGGMSKKAIMETLKDLEKSDPETYAIILAEIEAKRGK